MRLELALVVGLALGPGKVLAGSDLETSPSLVWVGLESLVLGLCGWNVDSWQHSALKL